MLNLTTLQNNVHIYQLSLPCAFYSSGPNNDNNHQSAFRLLCSTIRKRTKQIESSDVTSPELFKKLVSELRTPQK